MIDLVEDATVVIVFTGLGLGGLLLALGIVWSPIGGAIALWMSNNRRGRKEVRFREAAYSSLLFLLPWIYLVFVLLGRTPNKFLTIGATGIILWLWASRPTEFWLGVSITGLVGPNIDEGTLGPSTQILWALVAACFAMVNAVMIYGAVRRLVRHDPNVIGRVAPALDGALMTPQISVFKSAALGFVLMIPMTVVYTILQVSTWEWSFSN